MKIKLFTWGFIIGSFCFFYGLMYHNLNLKLEQLSQEKNREMQKVELLKDNWLKNIIDSNVKLNRELILFREGEKVTLREIIKQKSLVIKIPYSACQPCLERELSNISSFEKKGFSVIIISTYPDMNKLKKILSEYQIQSSAYLMNSSTDLFDRNAVNPTDICLVLIDTDLSFEYLFFPIQTIDDVSEMYYAVVETELQKE